MKKLKHAMVLREYLMPRKFFELLSAKIANSHVKWIKDKLIARFIKKHKINLAELENPNPHTYTTFNDFFTRKLKKSVFGKSKKNEIASPCQAVIVQLGDLRNNVLLQAKSIKYQLEDLLLNDSIYTPYFLNGKYITFFLKPNHYHRYHMPMDGELKSTIYTSGGSFELDPQTEQLIPNLYCKNERLILFFNTAIGKLGIVLIGALYVGGIQTSWMNKPIKSKTIIKRSYQHTFLKKMDELGVFKYGSSIILLFEKDTIEFKDSTIRRNKIVNVGDSIAVRK